MRGDLCREGQSLGRAVPGAVRQQTCGMGFWELALAGMWGWGEPCAGSPMGSWAQRGLCCHTATGTSFLGEVVLGSGCAPRFGGSGVHLPAGSPRVVWVSPLVLVDDFLGGAQREWTLRLSTTCRPLSLLLYLSLPVLAWWVRLGLSWGACCPEDRRELEVPGPGPHCSVLWPCGPGPGAEPHWASGDESARCPTEFTVEG